MARPGSECRCLNGDTRATSRGRASTRNATPPHSSWMNPVEWFFAIITTAAIPRASFISVREVAYANGVLIDTLNAGCVSFVCKSTADDALTVTNREPTPQGTAKSPHRPSSEGISPSEFEDALDEAVPVHRDSAVSTHRCCHVSTRANLACTITDRQPRLQPEAAPPPTDRAEQGRLGILIHRS